MGGYQPVRGPKRVYAEPAVTAKRRPRFDFFCESCSKGFDCEEEMDIHVAETHVICTHPGCSFSGREEVVRAHKVKHAVVTDSPEEIAAWIAMRRHKYPKKIAVEPGTVPPAMSKLEKYMRASLRASALEGRKRRKERETQQPCIHWERNGRCKFGDTCSFAHSKVGVCTFFLNHGKCRHGESCKYQHIRKNSKELSELRDPHGQLLKKLLSPEVAQFESNMLQAIRHAVNNDFYQTGRSAAIPSEEDLLNDEIPDDIFQSEGFSSDEDEEDCGFSPISTSH